MKFLSLIFLMLFFGCQPKEDKPELDFVKIDIFSVQSGKALSIIIDFDSNTLIFDNYGQMPNYPSEGEPIDFNLFNSELPLDFEFFKLDHDEVSSLKTHINNDFLSSIKESNNSYNNTKQDDFIRFEGLMFQFKTVSNKFEVFSTKNYIILSNKENNRILLETLNFIKKNTKSNKNKEYINFISTYLE